MIYILVNIDLKVENNKLIIAPCSSIRGGWEKKFKFIAENSYDKLLDEYLTKARNNR